MPVNKVETVIPSIQEPISYAVIRDDENFLLYGSESQLLWQSFRYLEDSGSKVDLISPVTSSSSPFVSPPTPEPTSSPPQRKRKSLPLPLIICIIVFSLLGALGLALLLILWVKKKRNTKANSNDVVTSSRESQRVETNKFTLETIQEATANFSDDRKIGEGAFGRVYKGILTDGQEIAVKRLSRHSTRGDEEFKNEVRLIEKLQHKNLVKLLGFTLDGPEKFLIFELMKGSLESILFDAVSRGSFDWEWRFKVIMGISRGLLYLHEDSGLPIVHRDLKSPNILLAEDGTPKVSDFGTARLLEVGCTHEDTSRVVGTRAYLPPEYARFGFYSVKTDVYAFGILVLEIITGKKITSVTEDDQYLLNYAWMHWRRGSVLKMVDSSFKRTCSSDQVMRCVHVALLCVQESVTVRPVMRTVIQMLSSDSLNLPSPTQPAWGVNESLHQTTGSTNEVTITELQPR